MKKQLKKKSLMNWPQPEKVKQRVASLHEFNPMLGHRGCRLGNTYPESLKCRPEPSSKPLWQ
jgi:phosphoenolpyruvate synthase/pyruvate phosphate dikinase